MSRRAPSVVLLRAHTRAWGIVQRAWCASLITEAHRLHGEALRATARAIEARVGLRAVEYVCRSVDVQRAEDMALVDEARLGYRIEARRRCDWCLAMWTATALAAQAWALTHPAHPYLGC